MDQETTVVNVRKNKGVHPKFDVYIGRQQITGNSYFPQSLWANPFRITENHGRKEVIQDHLQWLLGTKFRTFKQSSRMKILQNLENLRGKKLGCWCSPEPCHGDNYVYLLKNPELVKKLLLEIDEGDNNGK